MSNEPRESNIRKAVVKQGLETGHVQGAKRQEERHVQGAKRQEERHVQGAQRHYAPVKYGGRALAEETTFTDTKVTFSRPVLPNRGGSTTGAFYTQYAKDTGETVLQGGTVSAGTGVVTIADIDLTDDTGVLLQDAGQHMYLVCTGNGVTADGVLLPGFDLTYATVAYAAVIPNNTLPTAGSATGKLCHIDLGVFTATEFLPSAAGSLQISFCPGNYTVTRV